MSLSSPSWTFLLIPPSWPFPLQLREAFSNLGGEFRQPLPFPPTQKGIWALPAQPSLRPWGCSGQGRQACSPLGQGLGPLFPDPWAEVAVADPSLHSTPLPQSLGHFPPQVL